ncbi:hypothetical protein LguiA_021774 [Lonicera macranthoides]
MESKKIVVEPPMSLSEEEIKQQSSSRKRKRNAGDLPHHQPETEEKNNNSTLVCDFATTSASPVWEELPTPFPSPITFFAGVASPLDGKVYAFGRLLSHHPNDCYSYTYRGLVFDPSSRSWTPCPAPTDLDYGYKSVAVVHNEHENPSSSRLVVFNYLRLPKAFNLATTQWENAFSAHHPFPVRDCDDDDCDPTPTSVGVGNLIYRFTHRKLYVLDTSSPKTSFKRVCGLNNKLPTYRETYGRPFLVYLGKGKLCIVWGCCSNSTEDARILHITCLKFWVGMDNRKNRLRAVIDRCDRFRAYGVELYDGAVMNELDGGVSFLDNADVEEVVPIYRLASSVATVRRVMDFKGDGRPESEFSGLPDDHTNYEGKMIALATVQRGWLEFISRGPNFLKIITALPMVSAAGGSGVFFKKSSILQSGSISFT